MITLFSCISALALLIGFFYSLYLLFTVVRDEYRAYKAEGVKYTFSFELWFPIVCGVVVMISQIIVAILKSGK